MSSVDCSYNVCVATIFHVQKYNGGCEGVLAEIWVQREGQEVRAYVIHTRPFTTSCDDGHFTAGDPDTTMDTTCETFGQMPIPKRGSTLVFLGG
jgi:hypothetical protein